MAEKGDKLRSPLDPEDPDLRIPGAFGAVHVIDRSAPGYPGAFMDPGQFMARHEIEGSPYNVPRSDLTYDRRFAPYVKTEDLRNPLSVDLGIRSIKSPQEMVISRIIQMMQDRGRP